MSIQHLLFDKNQIKLGQGLRSKDANIIAEELHKPIIKHFKRRKVIINHLDEIWAIDLAEMPSSNGFKYILVIIDCWSKYSWCVPIKNKTGEIVMNALKDVINKSKRCPKKIWSDDGKEFWNQTFKTFLKEKSIELYSTKNETKSCIVERLIKTLKLKMEVEMTKQTLQD